MKNDASSPASLTASAPLTIAEEVKRLYARSTRLAAERALEAFLRPPRIVPRSHHQTLLSTAKTSIVTVDGISIVTRTWGSTTIDSPTVLLSHGYNTNATCMLHFVRPLLDAGFRVVAWDQIAHGESGGEWGDFRVFIHTIQTMARRNSPLAGVIGHSLGATAAIMALAGVDDVPIACPRLVCMSAPTQMGTIAASFLRSTGCPMGLGSQFQPLMDEKNVWTPTNVRNLLKDPDKIRHVDRVLIIHDRDDTVATVGDDAEYLAGAIKKSRLELIQGFGHFMYLADPGAVQLVTNFIVDKLPTESSSSKSSKL